MELTGSLKQIKSRIDAADRRVNTITLEVFGDIPGLHGLMERALRIVLEEDNSPS